MPRLSCSLLERTEADVHIRCRNFLCCTALETVLPTLLRTVLPVLGAVLAACSTTGAMLAPAALLQSNHAAAETQRRLPGLLTAQHWAGQTLIGLRACPTLSTWPNMVQCTQPSWTREPSWGSGSLPQAPSKYALLRTEATRSRSLMRLLPWA
jgi:hypothetical protein